MQRLRQAEPSWLRSGQTTTLFSSETEKEPVSEARGGMADSIYARAGPSAVGERTSMAARELFAASGELCRGEVRRGAWGESSEGGSLCCAVCVGSRAGEGGGHKASFGSLRRIMRGFKGVKWGEKQASKQQPAQLESAARVCPLLGRAAGTSRGAQCNSNRWRTCSSALLSLHCTALVVLDAPTVAVLPLPLLLLRRVSVCACVQAHCS